MMWGSVKSQSFATYAHLSGVDVDREIQKLYGLKICTTGKSEKNLEPKICPHCKEICGPISKYCPLCGNALEKGVIEDDEVLVQWLMENHDLLTEYLNKRASHRDLEAKY